METKDILLFALIFAAAGFILYRKYVKKNQSGQADQKGNSTGSAFSSVKDDDYEPYS